MTNGWWQLVGGNWLVTIRWWQLVVDNWLMTICWWQLVGGSWLVREAGGGGGGGADTTLKTKTPHVNVGNKLLQKPILSCSISCEAYTQ